MEQIKDLIINIIFRIDTGSLSGCLAVVSSLYIPIAILIYQEIKEKRAFNEFEWDKTVLLQEVVKGWQILIAVLVSSVAIMVWNYPNIWLKLSLLALFAICITTLTINLIHLFKWFMSNKVGIVKHDNYRQELKFKFLNKLNPNESLDVWGDLFRSIEPENSYLKDYLKIFFKKFSNANKKQYWQYEMCLTQNMDRLYFQNPDFQNVVMDFVFNAYIDTKKHDVDFMYCKRTILKKLVGLLAKNETRCYFTISEAFDKKLGNVKDDDLVFKAVKEYSFDVLQEILSVYGNIPENNDRYAFEVFPITKWNISILANSKDKTQNSRAMGLFVTYLEMLPAFIGMRDDRINAKRAAFLDDVVFGMSGQHLSRKMIRIINLYFNQNFFFSYDNESVGHARIRNFIDNDYGFFFMDSGLSVSSSYDSNESEEQRTKRLMDQFNKEEKRRNKNTLKLLASVYKFLLNNEDMKEIQNNLLKYDVEDEKYKYRTDMIIVKSNLEDLKTVIDKVIEIIKQ